MSDTPDKVDLQLHAESTDAFDEAIANLMKLSTADFAVKDPQIWTADVTTQTGAMWGLDRIDQRNLPLDGTAPASFSGAAACAAAPIGARVDAVTRRPSTIILRLVCPGLIRVPPR